MCTLQPDPFPFEILLKWKLQTQQIGSPTLPPTEKQTKKTKKKPHPNQKHLNKISLTTCLNQRAVKHPTTPQHFRTTNFFQVI